MQRLERPCEREDRRGQGKDSGDRDGTGRKQHAALESGDVSSRRWDVSSRCWDSLLMSRGESAPALSS